MGVDPTADTGSALRRIEKPGLVLASASPRRADLLQAAGIAFEIMVADVDESRHAGEEAEAYVSRLSREKAEAIVALGESRAVLGADTVVVIDEAVLGKPSDIADARRMLEALSGRVHVVLTGVTIVAPLPREPAAPRRSLTRVGVTRVEFASLSAADLEWYLASGEPMGKAGAYAIQGRASRFVVGIEGSHANVVGLPVAELCAMCGTLGILIS